jgi:hypothetical protein
MKAFFDILEARARNPALVHALSVRRVLETVCEQSLTIVPDDEPVHEALLRSGVGRPVVLTASFESGDGKAANESCACLAGLTLRQARALGKGLGCTVLYSGAETRGEVCVLPAGGGPLVRCGGRDTKGVTRAYQRARGVDMVRFDCPPWGWIESVVEDSWRRRHARGSDGALKAVLP